jgi:hypothetical protein
MTQDFFFAIARLIFDALIGLFGTGTIAALIEFLRSVGGAG